jgi:peptidyl-tRNA hydrolase
MHNGPVVYLVINGTLGMSPGKIAAQTFQACQRLLDRERDADALRCWREQGTKTVVLVAQTPGVFARAQEEIHGETMVDEGMNEVPEGSHTVHASYPTWDSPRILKHKRLRMYTG